MAWDRGTSDLLRETEAVREQLVSLTERLDGFVQRLKAVTEDTTRDEEADGGRPAG